MNTNLQFISDNETVMKWPCAIEIKVMGARYGLFVILYPRGAQFILSEGQS